MIWKLVLCLRFKIRYMTFPGLTPPKKICSLSIYCSEMSKCITLARCFTPFNSPVRPFGARLLARSLARSFLSTFYIIPAVERTA